MSTSTRKSRPRRRRERAKPGIEWVGGLLKPPFVVHDRAEPYRPGLVLWLEFPAGIIVGQRVAPPEKVPGAVGQALEQALERPHPDSSGRPDRIRIDDPSLVPEIERVVGDDVSIEVGPTPELDEILESMIEDMGGEGDETSYLAGGHLSVDTVGDLFVAARALYAIKPWEIATETQVLRMDIPELEVDGACISIIGALGESPGFCIFPSFRSYETFVQRIEQFRAGGPRVDLGTETLVLSFENRSELPDAMLDEIDAHEWPVAGRDAYPWVERRERDGMPLPPGEPDVWIVTAAAFALTSFLLRHRSVFELDEFKPICESYFDDEDLEIRLTVPHDAMSAFEPAEPLIADPPEPRFRPRASRNAPCPCGSGKKYKKCHLPQDTADHELELTKRRLHAIDARLIHRLSRFAHSTFGPAWRRYERVFEDAEEADQLAAWWSVYGFGIDGTTVLDAYIEEHGASCSLAERAWLDAQRAVWLSVWEVQRVERGKTVSFRDLLSGEERTVPDIGSSESLVDRDVVLARLIDHEGMTLYSGVHPMPLPPVDAAEVVRRARGRLRRKKGDVPVERLRDPTFGAYLIRRWDEAVENLMVRSAKAPIVHNTDDEPILLTTDHFRVEPGAREVVARCLAEIEGAEPGEGGGGDDVVAEYVFLKPADRTAGGLEHVAVGRAWISGDVLRVETNSVARADLLRQRVEAACGGLIRHRGRVHLDPRSPQAREGLPETKPGAPPPEAQQLVLDFKRRHYETWPDVPLPALGGRTPREAARTADGRRRLDQLIKEMEHAEARMDEGARFDFAPLRRELGVEGR